MSSSSPEPAAAAPFLRIVSDLHVGEPVSRLQSPAGLAPLFDDGAHVVFNGDTLETRFLDDEPGSRERLAAFRAFCGERAGRVTVLTGNHDPDIGPLHHLDLDDGRIFVTHGDTLFPSMTPWGWEAPHFLAESARRAPACRARFADPWEARVRLCKETTLAIRHLSPQAPANRGQGWHGAKRYLRAVRRATEILRSWLKVAPAGAALLEEFRPDARVLLVGHVHLTGVWCVRGRWIINTGSAMPPLGGWAADLHADRLELRRLHFRGGGVRVGRVRRVLDKAALFRQPAGP